MRSFTKHIKSTTMTTHMNNDKLRELYLIDLQEPDTHHGRTNAKVKYINVWANIETRLADGITEPKKIDLMDPNCPTVWVWSDQHFGHQNIIKYTNRPYPNANMMNQCMEGNYINVVKPDDVCIFVGDFGFMKEDQLNEILGRLPGYKILVYGNHDMHRSGQVYDLGFDESHLCMALAVEDHDFKFHLVFTHYPMTNVPTNCQNVHGHIHDNLATHEHTNVCVEHTNYAPRNLKEMLPDIKKRLELYDER